MELEMLDRTTQSDAAYNPATALSSITLEMLKRLVASGEVKFPQPMRQIGQYAFQHPYQMAFLSVREIAQATGSSSSSVQRFARLLGFEGYKPLRNVFRKHIARCAGGTTQARTTDAIACIERFNPLSEP